MLLVGLMVAARDQFRFHLEPDMALERVAEGR